MKRISINVFLLLCLILIFSPQSMALSKLGHQFVCQLSYEKLLPNTKIKVDTLINSIPKKHLRIIKEYNHLSKKTKITFAHACTWPDAIKKQKKYQKFSSWHYVNVPRSSQKITPTHCKENCLPQAIITHQKQLADTNSQAKQREALMFVGHWLGDIHQPLHVSFKSDLGGNKTKIQNKLGKCDNLHWYWDECLLQVNKKNKNALLTELRALWQVSDIHKWQPNSAWLWANETFKLTRSTELKYCNLDQNRRCMPITKAIKINKAYAKKYHPILKQQLVKAAHRLTNLLEATM